VTLVGPSDSPTQLVGTLAITTQDGDTSFSGTADLDIGLEGDCTVPSRGTIIVSVDGTYGGEPVDADITLAFHDSPECGYISIE
jgi:hypothetical protein